MGKHDHLSDHIFRRVLHYVERTVATITLIVLILSAIYQVYLPVSDAAYLFAIRRYLIRRSELKEEMVEVE